MPSTPTGRAERGPGLDPGLYVLATPLGNLADLSPRVREVLTGAAVLFTEDTRSARRLLADSGIPLGDRPLLSCFDANEAARAAEAAARVKEGQAVALFSEAGTPLVSDPGYRLVRAVADAGGRVIPVPGPSAVLAALVAAALPTDQFAFLGFPPRRPAARRRFFEPWRDIQATLVFYESPQRTAETLADLVAVFGAERRAALARELTKPFEEIVRGSLADLAERYREARPLGEVTLVVAGASEGATSRWTDDDIRDEARSRLEGGETARDVTLALTALSGRPRREVYALVNDAGATAESNDPPSDAG